MSRSFVAIGGVAVASVIVLGFTLADRAGAGAAPLTSSIKGPPWISVEYPANPHDPATRGAVVVLHSYYHGVQVEAAATASAITLVDGERRTVPLEVTPTSRGVYAVHGVLPENAPAVLVLRTREGGVGAAASALVALGGGQDVLAVHVPHDAREGGRWFVPREPTDLEVDNMLRTAVAMDGAVKAAKVATAGK